MQQGLTGVEVIDSQTLELHSSSASGDKVDIFEKEKFTLTRILRNFCLHGTHQALSFFCFPLIVVDRMDVTSAYKQNCIECV